MFEWWIDLPMWARCGAGLLIIAIAAALYFFTGRFYPYLWGIGAVAFCAALCIKDDWI